MIEQLRKLLKIRSHYKAAFLSASGQEVLSDLIRKHMIADPIAADRDATLVNIGMQRATVQILQKVYGSDKDLHDAITREYESKTKTENP